MALSGYWGRPNSDTGGEFIFAFGDRCIDGGGEAVHL